MEGNNNTRKLYDALKNDGYVDLGDFSSFEGKLKDSGKRERLYEVLTKDGWQDLGDFSQFESKLGYVPIKNEDVKEIDYVSQSNQNPAPIALRQEVEVPMKDQSEYVNPWTNSPDYNFESLRKKGKIETATPPPPTEYEKDSSFMNTWVGDAIQKLNAGGADLGAGIFGVLDKATKGLESATGGMISRGGAFKDISDRFKADAEFSRARSNRYNGKDFTDLWKEGDYMGAIGDIALQGVESLPMSIGAMAATMAGAPAAGLTGIGTIVASQKYDDLDQNNPNMGEFAKVSNAILTGTAESLSEMLGAGVSKAWMSTLFKTLGKEKAQEAIKRGIMGKIQEFYKKFGMFFEPVNEGIEEVSSTLAENITDKITGADPERDLTDGVLQSFVYGMGGGAYFTGAGALAKGAQYAVDKIGGKQGQRPITDFGITDQGANTPPQLTKSRFEEALEQGRNMTDPGDIRMANQKMEETRVSLSEMVPGLANTIERYVDDGASEAQVMSLLDGVNADARPLAEDFYADYLKISGLNKRVGKEIGNEVETYVANNITPYVTTNSEGQSIVTTATLSEGNEERPVYVRSIEGDKAVISDNGQDRMISTKRLSDIVEQDADQMKQAYEDQLLATRQSELDMAMNHNPKTQLPKPGLVIWNGDNAFILQGQDENGDWIAQPAALDKETGQVAPKAGSTPAMPITERDILALQDAMYDAQQANGQVATQLEGSNVSGEQGDMSKNENQEPVESSEPKYPLTKDGKPDYKKMTAAQRFAYTSETVSPEEALSDLNADIKSAEEALNKIKEKISKATGPERMSLRDQRKAKEDEIKEMRALLPDEEAVNTGREQSPYERYVDTGEVDDDTVNLIVDKISKGEALTPEEESMRRGASDRVESRLSDIRDRSLKEAEALNAEEGVSRSLNFGNEDSLDAQGAKEDIEPASVIMREDGTPDFISSGVDATLDFLYDKYGEKMPKKIEVTRKAFEDDLKKVSGALDKAQEAYDNAPIGKEGKAEAALIKARQEYDAIKVEADFWANLDDDIKEANKKPGDVIAKEISVMGDPMSGEELAAMMLANGAIRLTRDSYKKETGAGNNETSKMFGLFASPEKGGVNIERAGEILELADRENGTNFFDENDPNAGRDAIIEVLSSARTRGDLVDYVKRNREAIAERERQAEYNAYTEWCEENYHISPEEYEAYEESIVRDFSEKQLTDEERGELDSQITDEIQAIIDEQNEIDAILERNKPIDNENVEGNDESGGDGLREGSGEILPREQLDQTGRAGETEAREQVGTGIDRPDGTSQEGASGKVDRLGNPIDSEGNLIIEDVSSVSDITDEDFINPKRSIGLPPIPQNISEAIASDGKKVIIKRNIFEKNAKKHAFDPQSSRGILEAALYNTDIVGQSQPLTRKNHWLAIKLDDKSPIVVLEVNHNKDNVEIVGWYTLDNRNLDRIKRQAEREGGELLILTPKGAAASLSTLPDNSSSTDKGSASSSENQVNDAKSFVAPSPKENENPLDYAERIVEAKRLYDEERKVDTNPTEAQKEVGNYKKGHIKINGFDVSIEQPAGSVRSGKDANGKEWSVTMNNTYGYIRGTEGVDGDHIDVFLGPDMNSDMVYVVDQVNTDGSFDEHKVMMGFSSLEDAKSAYLSNYEEGWQGLGNITGVTLDEFKKWIDSSTRKTKAFAEYKGVKTEKEYKTFHELLRDSDTAHLPYEGDVKMLLRLANRALANGTKSVDYGLEEVSGSVSVNSFDKSKLDKYYYSSRNHTESGIDYSSYKGSISIVDQGNQTVYNFSYEPPLYVGKDAKLYVNAVRITGKEETKTPTDTPYTITPAQYTTKRGKVLDMRLVKFGDNLTKEQQSAAKELAKVEKGWYDRERRGFMMRSDESARRLADTILNDADAVSDAQPISLEDTRRVLEPQKVNVENLIGDINDEGKAKLSDHTVTPSGNRLVTDERYAELRERMRKKLGGQMNMGIDPEILAIGTEMAVYHIEKGLRKFSDYSKAMIDDLGDAIRPYLKSFYNGARDLPEVGDNGWDKDMTTYEDVRSFDVANFDKLVPNIMDVAETVVKETEIAGQASVAEKKIKNSRKKQTDNKDKTLPLYGNDLFTPNNIKDNEQGNSRADQGVGRKAREEDRGSERGGDRGGVHGSDVLDTERGRGIPVSDSDKRPVVRNQNNFSFQKKGIELPSGDISKLKANIEAIETLKDVEDGQGKPTPEQQAKMSRYVGWGGLAEALNESKYNARDNNWIKDRNWNDKYLRYYEKLKSLLSKEEFDSAVRSTTTSHYTPSEVVESLWRITEKLGFRGGNVSEPAMGIGNIIGMMPRSISEKSSISGFEIDSLSGRMAKALYPDANIKVQGYEKAFSPNSKDLVITNVPFGKNAPYDKVLDKQFRKKLGSSYNLHNYFILKGLLELKDGGLGVFVTSSATMDGADSKFREYVSGNGYDLVGAIRLPNDAFQKGAGTSVTADIVIFRKRKSGEPSNGIGFTSTMQIGEGTYMEDGDKRSKPIMVNEYFSNHPDMMLGEMMTAYDAGSGGLYSGASQTLKAKPGADLSKELFNAIDNLPKNILSGIVKTKEPEVVDDSTLKDGTITVQNGNVFVLEGGALKPVKANPTFVYNGKTRKIADAVNDYNDIKKKLYDLIHDEQTKGVDPEPARKRLNKAYDAFVSKYGTLNRNKALDDIFAEDVEHGLPFSLETVRRVPSTTGKSMVWEVSKADGILNKRVSYPFELPTKADNILDAVNISKSYKGNIDIPYISKITGMGEVNVTNEILEKGIAYRDPVTGNIIDKSEYLSGNVKDKLVEAKAALEDHPEFQKNVDDLEAVQPERIPYGEISYRLGTTWIPSEFINNFADNVLGISYANANFIPEIGEYILDKRAFITDYAKAGQFKTERMDAIDVFKAALNQRKPKIYDEIKYYEDGKQKTRRVVNEQETQAIAEKISDMSDKFVEYIDSKTMFHGRIEDVYNDKYNNYVLKKYDKPVFEHYPNANKNITLRDHQSKAVQRCLSESTLLAHQVGTGKTFTMITSAMEMRRLGIAKKPMIVVQNATLEDFVRDFYKLYPSAKILSPTKEERNADNRTRLFNLIATGDFDAIVVPQSFMAFIPDSEERKKAYIQKRIDDFEEAIDRIEDKALQERLKREAKSMRDSLEGIKKGKNVKGKAKTAETITAKTERILDRRTDNVMTFEQMGVDALFIDEAHNYKKIGFPSKMSNVKGIDTSASQRANSMLLKAQWISENNGGRNVVLATGTPITNTMAEVWTMMNFVAPDILDAYNINSFDEFATTFGTVEPSLEFTATGNFKIAERFKSYTNVPELIKAFRSHTDVVLTEDVKEFKEDKNIPKLKDDKMTNVIVEKNEDLEDVMQILIKELEDYNKLTGKEKKDKSALPLVVFSKAKQAAIDLRLLNPTFPDNPDSKTNKVVDNVLRLYKESDKDKGTQLIFCDSYQSPSETPKMDLFDVDLSVPQFNLYNDIKEKLIKGGIPSNQIAIVGNYEGERRNALFDKVRNGDVRILIGSTEKMGVGVNVQDRLFALHHIDAPIRPMDFEQRNGRILRQGNLYATWDKPVNIVTYGVKGTLDATAYDRLRIKQNFINQMMKGDISSRVMEEQDDSDPSGMTFSEMAATLSGDKTAQLLFVAQNKLKKLQNSKRSDLNSKSSMRDSISKSKLRIQEYNSRKEIMERNANIVKENFPDGVESVTVKGNTFSGGISNELTPIIEEFYDRYTLDRNTPPLKMALNGGKGEAIVHFNEGMMVYSLYLGKEKLVENRDFSGGKGLMASIDRQLGIPAKSVSDIETKIKAEENKIAGLEEAVKKPWGKEDELNAAQAEVNDLQRQLVEKAKAEDIQLESTLDVDGTLVKEEGETRFRFMGVDTTNNQDNVSSIESTINDWSTKLNTPVRVIHDVDDITDSDDNMLARKRYSKGWYDTSTGDIVIVSPNSTSVGDAQRTFLHEVVGHHGLRELFGGDFDTFLDNVYRNANVDIRKNIIDRTKGNPFNLREATEEYLAELAERDFDNKAERSLWEKIKDAFLDMLRKAGITLDFKLSDNDLRYILWRSYKNLEQGNLMDVAEDIVMRNGLGINNINLNENGSIARDTEPEKGKQPSETKGTGRKLETIEGVNENGNESERDDVNEPRGVENAIDGTENTANRDGRTANDQVDNDGNRLDGGDTGDRSTGLGGVLGEERGNIVSQPDNNTEGRGDSGTTGTDRGAGGESGNVDPISERTDDFTFAERIKKDNDNIRFREAKMEVENGEPLNKEMVEAWDKVASSNSFKLRETLVDSLAAIESFLKLLAEKTKSKILDYENPYYTLVALSSKNKANMDSFDSKFLNPLNEAIRALIGDVSKVYKKGLRRTWDWSKGPLRDLVKYVQAKHGIERNRDMSVRDGIEVLKAFDVDALSKMGIISEYDLKDAKKTAEKVADEKGSEAYKKTYDKVLGKELKKGIDKEKAERSAEIAADYRKSFVKSEIYNKEMDKYKEQVAGSLIDRWEDSKKDVFNKDLAWDEEQKELDQVALSFQWKLGDTSYGVILGKDYSGLSSVFKPSEDGANKDKWLSDAYDFVRDYESTHEQVLVDNLWDKVRNVSEYTLRKQYESGLISKSYMDKNLSRFKYFIPLRGFADNIASDVYDYIDATEIKMGNPVKTARGRTSEADNPFAGLIHVGYGSIIAGNRNLAKQRFLNLVSNHDTGGLITIDNIWVRNVGTEENPEWVESVPQIPDNASGEEVAKAVKDHEEMMRELREEGKAELIKGGKSDIPYKTLYDQRSQHQVQVFVGGNRYVMTVNGNPRLAQAVNGLTNPDVKDDLAYVVARNLKTFMAGAFTSKNVAFSFVNLIRDTPYANNSVFVTENFRYFKDFTGNQRRVLLGLRSLGRNLYKYRKGEIDISDKEQAIFKEFMDNGGATGYTFVETQKEYARGLADKLEKLSGGNIGKLSPKELVSTLFECFEFMGNVAELVNRYAAYKTSREHGRSVDRSINDAKEVSVNFNKKGAGKKTKSDKWYINTAAWISEYGRDWVLFFNAAVQSIYKEYSMMRNHPIKGIGSRVAPVIFMGSSVSLLNNLFMPMLFAYLGWDSDDDDRDYFDSLSDHERQNNICIRLPYGRWLKIPLAPDIANYFKIGDIISGHLSGKREMEAMDVVKTGIDMVSPLNINWEYDNWKFALNFLPTVVQPIAQNASNVNFMGNPIYKTSMNRANDYDPEHIRVYKSTSSTMVELSRALNSLTGGDDVKRGTSFNPATWQNILTGYTGGFGTVALGVSDLIFDLLSGEDGDMPVSRYPLLSRFLTGGDKDLKISRINSTYNKKVTGFVTEIDHDYKGYLKKIQDPSVDNFDRAGYMVKLNQLTGSDDYRIYMELSQYVKAISDMERFLREVGSNNDSLENQVYELKLRALEIFENE